MAAKKKVANPIPPWQRGGPSPNPKGRPKGALDKRTRISKELLDATSDIAKKVISQAQAGDLAAANLVFARVLPSLSPQDLPVKFSLDPTQPLDKQCEQILSAVASGDITPDVAKKLIECVSSLGTIRHLENFENRLIELENAS